MILIADSGSTKCDWILVSKEGVNIQTSTMGFNPFFHSTELVHSEILENEVLTQNISTIDEIYFYGAGCSSKERNDVILKALKAIFVKASKIVVDHDLTGAALATTQGQEGITCIIGTGSNSCYFDGKKIHEAVPALGYILGDEGSGSYFGKIVLADWLYNRMPTDIKSTFEERYNTTKEEIFLNVYNRPNANVYLASYMKIVSDNREHPYFKDMIYSGMAKFINIHVWCFPNFREVPVHFVGSIAHYFREVLEEVAKNHRFTIGVVEKKPINPLAKYHLSQST